MPLHGKIVVVKRTGGDGTEFPLTASCLFGRKADCDIRIQLPQVSKEHCRIDLNENKEVILTNLSLVNPTRVNGEALQQSERLKDGDVITIVDRSFRFEYPPAPTPKKFAKGSKAGTPNPHLKDGTNLNIQRSLEQAQEKDPKMDGDAQQSKTVLPFSDLYQMIRKSLDVKTPRKSSGTYIQMPRKSNVSTNQDTPKVAEAKVSDGEPVAGAKNTSYVTPMSDKKRKNSPQVLPSNVVTLGEDAENVKSEVHLPCSPQTRQRVTPQRFSATGGVEKICSPTPKSPMRRRSQEATPAKEHDKVMPSPQNTKSPGASGKGVPRKRKSAELVLDSPAPQMKKKRVSFGGYLVPELFDKKMPPDSPLRKGENPRRSLCLAKPKQSLLRRASVIGLPKEPESHAEKSFTSPKTSVKKSPKGRSPSSKKPSPEPKPRTPSPHGKLPKSPASSKDSPGKKSPKANTPSAKASLSGEKSPKAMSSSPASSEKTSRAASPKPPKSTAVSPALKSPKPNTSSAKSPLPGDKSPKSRSSSPASSEKTSKFSTPRRTSSSGNKLETPLSKGPTYKEMPDHVTRASPRLTPAKDVNEIPVKTPQGSRTAQGRFSVSRIETPSPVAEDAAVVPVHSVTVTPKIPLRRKSMKSTARKTPLTKSAIKVIRRSGISRASIKAMSSWADTVKFGQAKVQAALPVVKAVKHTATTRKVTKKMVTRAQTPLRKQLGHASTGHAESPVTIVVGRAFKQKVTHPVAAVPKVIFNTAISKQNMNMDEDLSGISEMFKTPGKRRSEINRRSSTKTPLVVNEPSALDPSVLNTPEEPGEMSVSPLSLASTAKTGRYNKEAVKRLLNGTQESSFLGDTSALEKTTESVQQQCTEMKESAVTTPKQKPQRPECLTGVKRLLKTPKQKAEPLEDLRGKLLKTPKQKPEQQECLTGVKRIMRTPRQKTEPVEDLRGKLLKTPTQKSEQQECLTGVKRIFSTPKQSEPIDLQGKLLKTPTDAEVAEISFSGVAEHLETPAKDSQEQLPALAQETQDRPEPTDCLSGVKRVMRTPRPRHAPVEGVLGIERLMRTPKERGEPVDDNFGIKQLMRSPRLRGTAPVEDFEGLQELLEEPAEFKDQPLSSDLDVAKDFTQGQPQDNGSSDVYHDIPQIDIAKAETSEVFVEVASVACESSEDKEAVSQVVTEEAPGVTEKDTASDSANSKKLIRGRRVKAAEPVAAESSQYPVVATPVRGRRAKKFEPTEPPAEEAKAAPKPRRGRYAKKVETVQGAPTETSPEPEGEQSLTLNIEPVINNGVAPLEKASAKPKRGRYAKKVPEQMQTGKESAVKTLPEPESLPVDIEPAVNESVAPSEKETMKPKRGRYAKKALEQTETVPEAATENLPEPDSGLAVTDSVTPLEDEAVKPKRGRHAKQAVKHTETVPEPATENLPEPESEPVVTDGVASLEEDVVKPKRGRHAKKALEQIDTVPEASTQTLSEPESEPTVTRSGACLEEEAVKPILRGRKPKQSSRSKQAQPSACSDDVSQHDASRDIKEVSDGHQEQMPTEHHENKSTDPTESLPEVPVVQKKSVRGRRGNPVEDEQGAALEEVRATRRKRTEAIAPPAGRQATRSRKTKAETVPEKDVEVNVLTGTSETNTSQEGVSTPAEDSVVKPSQGRKTKRAPVDLPEPEKALGMEQVQLPAPTNRKGRGRKVISETVELEELEKVTSEETNDRSKPLARGTRGRNAKREKERESSDKTSVVQSGPEEPIKRSRSRKDDQTVGVENLVPVEAEPRHVSEPELTGEHTSGLAKTRRGTVRKPKQAAATPDSTENRDGPIETPTEKPQRSRRAKQVEDVTSEVTGQYSELEQKQQRGRGMKTSLKDDPKQVVAAKRARRGPASASEEAQKGPGAVPESAPASVEPVKRGRRPLAKSELPEMNKKQSNASSDSNTTSQEPQNTQRSVKWNLKFEVHEIPKRSLRAVRGKRSSPGDHTETQSQSESENAAKTEENLSEKAAEPQPAKRARRGAKVAKEAESTREVGTNNAEDAETQPKNRRGRSAKK